MATLIPTPQVVLGWDPALVPVDGYNLYKASLAGGESNVPVNGSTLIQGTTYTDQNVLPGQAPFYKLRAVVNGVESLDSLEVHATPVPFNPTPAKVDLGYAGSFGVLAGSTITNTGPTVVMGDIGVWPGTAITGFPPGIASGLTHAGDYVAQGAQGVLSSLYAKLAAAVNPAGLGVVLPASGPYIVTSCADGTSGTTLYTGTFLPGLGGGLVGQQMTMTGFTNAQNNGTYTVLQSTITTVTLNNANGTAETATAAANALASDGSAPITMLGDIGGQRLTPGVYTSASSLGITGPLILDAQGNPNAVFIFQVGSALTVAGAVILVGGAQPDNVYWQVGSSATIGSGSVFAGNLLAQASITVVTGASINGRLLARKGAVTLDTAQVSLLVTATMRVLLRNTYYNVNDIVFSCASGSYQRAIIAGTTGPTEPIFNTGPGSTTQDGTVLWSDPPENVVVMMTLPPSPPNVAPAPPAAPTGLKIVSEQ